MTSPKGRRKQWTRLALFGSGAMLVAVLAVVVFIATAQGPASGNGPSQSLACSPQPCLDIQNYTIWVSNVTVADGLVHMNVTFRNSSGSTHADPSDLQLVDASKNSSPSVEDAPGCTHWSRTEFSNGAKLGPLTVCFRPASTASPLTLHWTPDMGFICCDGNITRSGDAPDRTSLGDGFGVSRAHARGLTAILGVIP